MRRHLFDRAVIGAYHKLSAKYSSRTSRRSNGASTHRENLYLVGDTLAAGRSRYAAT